MMSHIFINQFNISVLSTKPVESIATVYMSYYIALYSMRDENKKIKYSLRGGKN